MAGLCALGWGAEEGECVPFEGFLALVGPGCGVMGVDGLFDLSFPSDV